MPESAGPAPAQGVPSAKTRDSPELGPAVQGACVASRRPLVERTEPDRAEGESATHIHTAPRGPLKRRRVASRRERRPDARRGRHCLVGRLENACQSPGKTGGRRRGKGQGERGAAAHVTGCEVASPDCMQLGPVPAHSWGAGGRGLLTSWGKFSGSFQDPRLPERLTLASRPEGQAPLGRGGPGALLRCTFDLHTQIPFQGA